MGLKDYTDDDRRLTEDGSRPYAMVNVQNLIKRHIKIAPYDTNPVTTHVAPKIGVTCDQTNVVKCHKLQTCDIWNSPEFRDTNDGQKKGYLSQTHIKDPTEKSVKSLNPFQSVIQTIFDIVKAQVSPVKYLFFFIILFLSSTYCYAQSGLPAELHFKRLTVKNGLPEGTVLSMIQGKEGYIWMSTQQGLVRYDGYHTRVYTMGITDPNKVRVDKIFQDRKGRLWVGMYRSNSIYLYSRQQDRFILCRIDSSAADSTHAIFDIHDDNRGRLWIESRDDVNGTSSFCFFNPETGKYEWYGKQEKGKNHVNAAFLNDMLQDASGHIWLSSANGLYEFNEKNHSFTGYLATPDSAKQKGFVRITEDSTRPDHLWLTNTQYNPFNSTIGYYTQKGLYLFDTKNDSAAAFYHDPDNPFSIASDTVFTVFNDHSHRLWVGTERGLSLYDPAKNNFINYYPKENQFRFNDAVINITEDKAGNFWCQTGFGLLYFNTRTRTFRRITANPKQSDGLITNNWSHTLMLDKNGTLWFGVQLIGVQWVNNRRSGFVQYSNNPGALHFFPGGTVSPLRLYGFAKDSDGTVWIGADHGLYHWHPGTDSFTAIKFWKGKADNPNAGPVMVDQNGKIWFGGGNNGDYGLDCYDPRTGKTSYYRYNKKDTTSVSNNNIFCIYQDHLGNLWVGTDGGGICKLDPETGKFTRYPYIRNNLFNHNNHGALDDDQAYFIVEDRNGTLWVGTNSGSINRFNRETGTFTSYLGLTPGFTSILSIKEGPKNDLWVGTYEGGLFRFNPRTTQVERFTEKNGLLYNGAFAILRDNRNNLWLPSFRGISILNPQTGEVRNLTSADGLPGSTFTFGLKVSNSQFLFACDNGFISVNPEDFTPDTHAPVVHIQSAAFTIPGSLPIHDSTIVAFGKKNIKLSYNENRLTFKYVGLYYQNADLVHYAYKLDGYDKNWISTGTERTAVYTNLSPGTYTFRVKAANPDGVWSTENPSLIIVINPPWWQTWWAYIVYAILFILTLWTFIAYRSRNLKKANKVLEGKVSDRTRDLQESLTNLKATQSQLIQAEKMASLGELTAGIAHEIQNPLNFVNNFSEVSTELLEEMREEIEKGNFEEVKVISEDLNQNLEKILNHGRRADGIVKGMLQHSRGSSGQKEPTDINALADEFLRLSYHGLRARDKSFNADFKLDADEALPKVSVVPQDIGRVLLNLINNAFYAVSEKAKQNPNAYKPSVIVSTRQISPPSGGRGVEIRVKDNGHGIPDEVKEKIFQPFFTTKPTGQGTGLGLSMSYDIIKTHGGELKVESSVGEGTTFTIQLPKTGSV